MGDVEKQPDLQLVLGTLQSLSFGVVILAKSVVATGFVRVELLVVSLLDEFVVDLDGLSESPTVLLVLAHVKTAVGQPQTVLDVRVQVPFVFEEGYGSNPVPILDVFL